MANIVELQENGVPQYLKTHIKAVVGAYAVGDIHISINSTNPSERFGGMWERFGKGRTIVGVDDSDSVTLMKTANNEGGKVNPLTAHSHNIRRSGGSNQSQIGATINWSDSPDNAGVIHSEGDNTNHNNWQPFITVYMWVKIA